MSVLVAGADGYLGFSVSMHLANNGYDVVGVDNFYRRRLVKKVGSKSVTPIASMSDRLSAFNEAFGKKIRFEEGDLRDYDFVSKLIKKIKPDTILNLGQLSSSSFSMIDAKTASLTQSNNIVGNLNILHAIHDHSPTCKLVKMGSMGEYGAPNIEIPEGNIEIEYKGRKDSLPFPKRAFTDWYHWSKVHDSGNTMLACEIWNLAATDVMQGVVYGIKTQEMVNESLQTRFDIDPFFGTVLNRFVAQAATGKKLTIYGKGKQKRPFISLQDAVKCLKIAIDNPPADGEYRVFNQFDEVYNIIELADKVKKAGNKFGLDVEVEHIKNPRLENECVTYYEPVHTQLYDLGFNPGQSIDTAIVEMLKSVIKYKKRIEEIVLI